MKSIFDKIDELDKLNYDDDDEDEFSPMAEPVSTTPQK